MGAIITGAKGKIKQAIGDLTSNKDLKAEGDSDVFQGKVKGAVKDVKHALKDVKHALNASGKDLP